MSSWVSRSRVTTAWVMARLPADLQYQHPVAGTLERRQVLRKAVDLVDAGAGAGVGQDITSPVSS